MSQLIYTKNVTVLRQGKEILKNVSINVQERDFMTIIGPNGAGKSMLLKCMMGFYAPDLGVVNRANNLKIGYVPQRFVPEQSIPISVERFLRLRKNASVLDVANIATDTQIDGILKKPLSNLSGGELQRVLLARSLLSEPDLLILDEPAQNLDVAGQLSFYRLLERIYEDKSLSVLMVSHDLHMVMATTKQVVCLYHHICCSGEPQVVTRDPEFISLFGNDLANMMAVYQHKHNHTHEPGNLL